MNKILFGSLFAFVTLQGMELSLPSSDERLSLEESRYFEQLEPHYLDECRRLLHVDYAGRYPKDSDSSVIERFGQTALDYACKLRDPNHKKKFVREYELLSFLGRVNKREELMASVKAGREMDQALFYILAEPRVRNYVARGTYEQPWVGRSAFDQQWSTIVKKAKASVSPRLRSVTPSHELDSDDSDGALGCMGGHQ